MQFELETIESPIGTILLVSKEDIVYSLDFQDYERRMMTLLSKRYGEAHIQRKNNPSPATHQIKEYFAGNIHALAAIEIAVSGTDFQQHVWRELQAIPPGETHSYSQLAVSVGNPKAVRAVGMANARNPIALIIPCHRVIAANGTLSGYAGGVERKRWLLEYEKSKAGS